MRKTINYLAQRKSGCGRCYFSRFLAYVLAFVLALGSVPFLQTEALATTGADVLSSGGPEETGAIVDNAHVIIDIPSASPGARLQDVLGQGIGYTTMHVCSSLVGRHGLCVLLENVSSTGKKTFGLVDTGNAGQAQLRAFLQEHGVRSLAFLVLTHYHKDHVGNAEYLLRHYPVGALYLKQFDAAWSDGLQGQYEKILRAAVDNRSVKKIIGVSYALSLGADASPKASQGFKAFLQKRRDRKGIFKGLFTETNTVFSLGTASVRLFNWEIWSTDGISRWKPGVNRRGKAKDFASDNSDNQFSMCVRVTQGKRKLWIGGDMNDLRLSKKQGCPYRGDEGRLKGAVGKVDAAILNHHGNGGSNSPDFLKALSPTYVIYTASMRDTAHSPYRVAVGIWNYLRGVLGLKEDQILWACDAWGFRREDPSVTITEKKIASACGDGSDMEPRRRGTAPAGKSHAVVPLQIGRIYTSYDVTGDGETDTVKIVSSNSGATHRGLQILVNEKVAWKTKVAFTDKNPVTLVLLPGRRAYVCISIFSIPQAKKAQEKTGAVKTSQAQAGTAKASQANTGAAQSGSPSAAGSARKADKRVFAFYRYVGGVKAASTGKKGTLAGKGIATAGAGFQLAYDVLANFPQPDFCFRDRPAITAASNTIHVACTGTDPLSGAAGRQAGVQFGLVPKGRLLARDNGIWKYCLHAGNGKGTWGILPAPAPLYASPESARASGTLAAGSRFTASRIEKNKGGIVCYRILDESGKSWWIRYP